MQTEPAPESYRAILDTGQGDFARPLRSCDFRCFGNLAGIQKFFFQVRAIACGLGSGASTTTQRHVIGILDSPVFMHQGNIPGQLQGTRIGHKRLVWNLEQPWRALAFLAFGEPAIKGLRGRGLGVPLVCRRSNRVSRIVHESNERVAGFLVAGFWIWFDPCCGGCRQFGSVIHDNLLQEILFLTIL